MSNSSIQQSVQDRLESFSNLPVTFRTGMAVESEMGLGVVDFSSKVDIKIFPNDGSDLCIKIRGGCIWQVHDNEWNGAFCTKRFHVCQQ